MATIETEEVLTVAVAAVVDVVVIKLDCGGSDGGGHGNGGG